MLNIISIADTAFHIMISNYLYILIFSLCASLFMLSERKTIQFFGFLWVCVTPFIISLFKIFENIGPDSLLEASNFDTLEILAYAEATFITNNSIPSFKRYLLYFLSTATIGVLITLVLSKFGQYRKFTPFLLLGLALLSFSNAISNVVINIQDFKILQDNFAHPQLLKNSPINTLNEIDVIIYVGESMNKQHMGLYGYYRNTTPNLDKFFKKGMLTKYSEVFSTHSHTSPSLLEALSIPTANESTAEPKTIFEKNRITIVELLKAHGINSHLYSNNSEHGTWNYASSIIFKKAETAVYNKKGHTLGNTVFPTGRILYDSDFIRKNLTTIIKNHGVTFFHSYAGHIDYCSNIPALERTPVDNLMKTLKPQDIVGPLSTKLIPEIECYDSAVRYVDQNLSQFITEVARNSRAQAFIYFSDHGESVYTGLGHDSSRFQLDMATVPLLIYLNDAAKEILDDKNIKFDEKKSLLTLDYIPYLIAKVLGLDFGTYNGTKHIMVRDTLTGRKKIDIKSTSTDNWLFNQYQNSSNPISDYSCLHRVNNLGKWNQGRLAFNCMEYDLVVTDDVIYIDHDYPADSKLTLEFILRLTKESNQSVWLDAKNIDNEKNCSIVANALEPINGKVLLEFPSSSIDYLTDLEVCFRDLEHKVDYISYYVPTNELLACTNGQIEICDNLKFRLRKINKSPYFNSISFDFRGIDFILSLKPELNNMYFHAWGIKNVKNPKISHLTMAIVSSSSMRNNY
jgi:glucan phosphoethanolaminetransferase (alkaline phosphatase superfamily)